MNTAGLSLDKIPAFHIPMGFFLIAPWFGILASLSLFCCPEAVTSRWNPSMLAIVHLLTLGFAAMIMLGAMIQVLPVVSNRSMPGAKAVTPWIRGFLTLGCLSLSSGFLFSQPLLFGTAVFLLGMVFLLFLGFMGFALIRANSGGATLFCLRLAALSLLTTVLLGVLQLSTYVDLQWLEYLPRRTDNHAMLGLLGWGLLLVMGVSFQVIPMFHVAPAFPNWLTRGAPPLLFAALITGIFTSGNAYHWAMGVICTVVLTYALTALRVLYRRKRKLRDYTVRFWQLALSNLLLLTLLFLLGQADIRLGLTREQLQLLLGVGLGLGFLASVILGMLQKIVPFLMYLHLQRACLHDPSAFMALPNMKELISSSRSMWQFRIHLMAVALIYIGLLFPTLQPLAIRLAALALLADFVWLLRTLLLAHRLYQRSLPGAAPQPVSVKN